MPAFLITPIFSLYNAPRGQMTFENFILIYIPLAFWVFMVIKFVIFVESFKDLSHYKEISENHLENINEIVEGLISRMKLPNKKVKILVKVKRFSSSPTTVEANGKINLILPLGFFKLLKSDPECAEAMIAHELAHSKQKDSGLLVQMGFYLKFVKYILIFDFLKTVFNLYLANYFLQDHVQVLLDKKKVDMNWLALDLASQMALTIFEIIISLLFFFFLRRRFWRAEELADFAAAIYSTPKGVNDYLMNYSEVKEHRHIYSLHPSIKRRLKKLESYKMSILTNS